MANIMNMFPGGCKKVAFGTVGGGPYESITVSGLSFEPAHFLFASTTAGYDSFLPSKVICAGKVNGTTFGGVSAGSNGAYGVEITFISYANGTFTITLRALGSTARFVGTYAYLLVG